MLRLLLILWIAVTFIGCSQKQPAKPSAPATLSSFDVSPVDEQPIAAHSIKFDDAPLNQVLDLYAATSRRSVIRGENLPDVKITFSNELPMTRVKVLQALDTVLAARKITVIPQGNEYVKVVSEKDAPTESPPIFTGSLDVLPDSSSYAIFVVELPASASPDVTIAMTPFSRLPNSIIYIPGNRPTGLKKQISVLNDVEKALGPKPKTILILRDYSSNLRNMLQVLAKVQPHNQ